MLKLYSYGDERVVRVRGEVDGLESAVREMELI